MKKMMFVAAMAAMVLSSCAKEETVNDATLLRGAIGFESFIGKTTKGAPVSGFANGAKMSIYGYTTPAAMGETFSGTAIANMTPAVATYTHATTSWSYSPAAYWAEGSFHTFFAVSPETITVTDGVAAIAVHGDVAQQQDLMVADPVKKQAVYADTDPTQVSFAFRHVLSQVKFSAKIIEQATDRAMDVKITKIVIAPTTATDKFKADGTVSIVAKPNANTDIYTVAAGSATADSYEIAPTAAVVVPTSSTYSEVKHLDAHTAMLLPQTVPAFTISVTVTYKDVKNSNAEVTETFDVKASSMTWECNKIYNYKMDISVPQQVLNLKPIEIDRVDIEDWSSTESSGDLI